MARYKIRFFFDWGCTPLWSGNAEANKRFSYPIKPEQLSLSPETISQTYELARWHDTALNWDYPPDPGPWRQAECDSFNATVKQLFELIQTELGTEFEVVNEQYEFHEDPDLGEYLKNPKAFNRAHR